MAKKVKKARRAFLFFRAPFIALRTTDWTSGRGYWARQFTLTATVPLFLPRCKSHAANRVKIEPEVTRNMDCVIFQALTTGYEVFPRVPSTKG